MLCDHKITYNFIFQWVHIVYPKFNFFYKNDGPNDFFGQLCHLLWYIYIVANSFFLRKTSLKTI